MRREINNPYHVLYRCLTNFCDFALRLQYCMRILYAVTAYGLVTARPVKNSAKGKMRWGLVTSRRALDAALVLDNPATREAHSLYERDPMPTCSHIAQSSSAQVLCVVHTKGATSVPGCAQLLPAQGVMGDGWSRAKSSARLPFDVRRTSTVCGAQRTTTPPSSTPCRVCSAPVC